MRSGKVAELDKAGTGKGPARNNWCCSLGNSWSNCVIPVAVELMRCQVDLCHLILADGDSLGIRTLVDLGSDSQARLAGCGANQVHDRGQADQRLTTPVHGNVGK